MLKVKTRQDTRKKLKSVISRYYIKQLIKQDILFITILSYFITDTSFKYHGSIPTKAVNYIS